MSNRELVTERSTEGLRDMLFTQLDNLLNGKIDVDTAKQVSKMSDSIVRTASIDLEAQRMSVKARNISGDPFKKLNLPLSRSSD